MLLIPCPWCGPRDDEEFRYGGEAHVLRPAQPEALSDAEWADYLFMKQNPKGVMLERWVHAAGCRQWFNVVRNTATEEIAEVYAAGSLPKSAEGLAAHAANWRRESAAERNANSAEGGQ